MLFSLTTTMRGICRATFACISTNEYHLAMLRRLRQVLVWASSSARSRVIGWCSVTIVGIIFSTSSIAVPRHWLSWTRSKSPTRFLSRSRARMLNASGSAKRPRMWCSVSIASAFDFSSQ